MTMTTDNSNKILNAPVPRLRFPDFFEEYTTRKIGQLTTKVGSGVTPKGGENVYTIEGHPFVRSQNVGNGQMFLEDIAFIDENTHKKQIATEIQKGDVLLNITGASIGRSSVAFDEVVGGNVNQHVCIVRPNREILPHYLCYLFLSDKGQKQIDSFQAGGNRQGLNFEQIKSFKFSIPTLAEQRKVSDLFCLIDERIKTQSRAIEKLQSLMEGLMKAHYKKSPKTIVRIKELGEYFTVMNLSKNDLDDIGIPCVLYGELFTTYHCTISKVKSKTSVSTGLTLSQNNDLLFPSSTTVDAVSLIAPSAITVEGVVLGGDMFGIHINENQNNVYLSFLFNYILKWKLAQYAQGSTIIHLHYNDIQNVRIEVPSLKSQLQFVELAMKLQQKIEYENRMLTDLHVLKTYLLQHMFI